MTNWVTYGIVVPQNELENMGRETHLEMKMQSSMGDIV